MEPSPGVDLLDKEGGEIRASFFNQGADMWTDKLSVGGCYTFSKGGVKIANRQYNSCNHRYELTFDKEAQITEIADDQEIHTMKALSIGPPPQQAPARPRSGRHFSVLSLRHKSGLECLTATCFIAAVRMRWFVIVSWCPRSLSP